MKFQLFSTIALSLVLTSPAMAAQRSLLGERTVGDLGDRDTISVGVDSGRFTRLQVEVYKAAVEFKRVVVHFENGDEQVFSANRVIKKGKKSRLIDLDGGSRYIDRVVFHYEARSKGWKVARIKLFGIR